MRITSSSDLSQIEEDDVNSRVKIKIKHGISKLVKVMILCNIGAR